MAKITRYDGNFKAFGSDATGTERTVFGSTTQTDDLTTNLGAEYQRGWGVLPIGQKPPKQYFNGALFGTSQAVAYLHQAGIAEWNGEQEYHAGSITNRNGQIFVCLTDDHVSASAPETDSTNWRLDDGSVATISALLNRTTVGTVNVLNYHTGLEGGGGVFYWDASKPKAEHNGGTVIDPDKAFPSDWNNQTQLTTWFTAGSSGTGVWCRQGDTDQMGFGTIANGTTDDRTAIQAAANVGVTFSALEHYVSDTIYVTDNVDMKKATFYTPNEAKTFIQIGTLGVVLRKKHIGIPKLLNPLSGSSLVTTINSSSVAVVIHELYETVIDFNESGIYGYGTGVKFYANAEGISYSEYNNIFTINCIKHIWFHCTDIGWMTECLFLKIRTANYDNFGTIGVSDFTGCHYLYVDVGSYHPLNNCTFIQGTFEGNRVDSQFYVNSGSATNNTFISPRFESSPFKVRVKSGIGVGWYRNTIVGGDHSHKVEGLPYKPGFSAFNGDIVKTSGAPIILNSVGGDNSNAGIFFIDPTKINANGELKDFDNSENLYTFALTNTGLFGGLEGYTYRQLILSWTSGRVIFVNQVTGSTGTYLRIKPETAANFLELGGSGLIPATDGSGSIGSAAARWNVIYATTGVINTSDERSKTELLDIDEVERSVAVELKSVIKKFKFLDAVEKKGDSARIHFGVGAQTVKTIFESHGLNPNDYALFCYDEWDATEGDEAAEVKPTEAGNRYGIRYEELLCFIISAL